MIKYGESQRPLVDTMSPGHNHPWQAAYPDGVDWEQPISIKPLYSFLDDSVAKYGDNPCIGFLGKKYTYKEIGNTILPD